MNDKDRAREPGAVYEVTETNENRRLVGPAQEQPWRERGYLRQWAAPTDHLSQVTDQLRLNDLICAIIRVASPYGRSGEASGSFHVIIMTHGEMYLDAIDGATDAPLLIATGDVLIMPRGSQHRFFYPNDVSTALEVDLSPVDYSSPPRPEHLEYIGLMCYLDKAHRNLLTDFLPSVIHLKRDNPGITRWLRPAVELFRAEYHEMFKTAERNRSLGCGSVLRRLAEFVCIESLRCWIEQMPADMKGWLLVLRDEGMATAVQAVHEHPERRWTVESLARQAGMSRSVFAARFKALVGESPMEYVSRWRMHRAVGLLEQGAVSLKSVIEASGYKSPTTFRTNFKRQFGIRPREYDRR
jgi:AraC-like DNA-binding protein